LRSEKKEEERIPFSDKLSQELFPHLLLSFFFKVIVKKWGRKTRQDFERTSTKSTEFGRTSKNSTEFQRIRKNLIELNTLFAGKHH
jgi:hypothetical protein